VSAPRRGPTRPALAAKTKPAASPRSTPTSGEDEAPRAPGPHIRRGVGRPRKPTAPRTEAQADLAAEITIAEKALDLARRAARTDGSVAAALVVLQAEQDVASCWASYLRAQGNMTHSLKFSEDRSKLAAKITALRERISDDLLAELSKRAHREKTLGGKR